MITFEAIRQKYLCLVVARTLLIMASLIPPIVVAFSLQARVTTHTRVPSAVAALQLGLDPRTESPLSSCESRRSVLGSCFAFPVLMQVLLAPLQAVAKGEVNSSSSSSSSENENSSRDRVARLLHVIPTFCIVDTKGVPYVVVGEDARVTGYFFTEYEEAERILQVARSSADKAIRSSNEPTMVNPWKDARISTLPMDLAATLVTKSLASRTHFQIAPSEADVEDALVVTGKATLAEGKVPLFYYENFTLDDGNSPLYFTQAQLQQAWKKQQGRAPTIAQPQQPNVTELFAVLTKIVQNPNDLELQSIVIVSPATSAARAKECIRKGGKEAPFLLGQQNLVL